MVDAFQHMDRFLYQLFDLEARLPRWLRAPYRGAVFIFGLILGWHGKLFLLAVVASLLIMAGVAEGLRLLSLFLGIALLARGRAESCRACSSRWAGPAVWASGSAGCSPFSPTWRRSPCCSRRFLSRSPIRSSSGWRAPSRL